MQKALLIAEKPSLRRTIEQVYKKHRSEIPYSITFMEQRGHLLTLKLPNELDESLSTWDWDTLPIVPEDYGGFKYKIIAEKKVGKFLTSKERYMAIKDELEGGSYDLVINAGDPDQEGELLIKIVLRALKNKLPVKRYWTNATTDEKVLDALQHLKDDDTDPMLVNLLAAAYGRQHSDYRFGINLSRAASLKMDTRVACGRVKTPILGIVCRREKEIANFVPSTCYGVMAVYEDDFTGQLFDISEESKEEKDGNSKDTSQAGFVWVDTEDEASEIIARLPLKGRVVDYESKKVESYAPKLYKLATAQIAAAKLGYNADKTLEIIQSLYEKGYMSYPRTDCEYISSTENLVEMLKSAMSVPELVPFIKTIGNSVIGKVKATKKWVNDKELAESGHSALVPTTKKPDLSSLTEDEVVIYRLICKRFVAIFMPPLVQNKTRLIVDIGGRTFKSTGKILVSAGFSKIFDTKFTDMVIPAYTKGQEINVHSFNTVTKTTTCPKHFTDGDLIEVCEAPHKFLEDMKYKALGKNLKIGTPATRAPIIKELIEKDKYLQRTKEKKTEYITPTATGLAIYENLKDCDICKIDLSAQWEEELELVRKGILPLAELEKNMREHVAHLVKDINESEMTVIGRSGSSTTSVVCKCPKCGGDILSGPKGFYCTGYKEGCKVGAYKKICDSTISDKNFEKLVSGKIVNMKIKKGTSTWEQEVKYDINTGKIEFVKREAEDTTYKCPSCNKELTDDGRVIKCTCGFSVWKNLPGGKTLTTKQLDNLFDHGNTGLIKGMKGKSGKSFDAEIVFNEDMTGTTFHFEN